MCIFMSKHTLTKIWNEQKDRIKGYHIHIYFDKPQEKLLVQMLVDGVEKLFPEHIKGTYPVNIVGPHTKQNIEIDITREGHKEIVEWLQSNNDNGLSILIHPDTGDDLKDHMNSSMWLGEPVPYNKGFFEKLLKARTSTKMNNHKP